MEIILQEERILARKIRQGTVISGEISVSSFNPNHSLHLRIFSVKAGSVSVV